MFPSERRDVGQEFGRDVEAGVLPGEDGPAELQRVPVDDDRGQQVEAGDPVVLSFLGSVSQFAGLVEVYRALEGMVPFNPTWRVGACRGPWSSRS